ncbi:DUF3153 domain-containing protein [Saccharopolyspora phatthalungensis]|uniref:LppM domain-containing protein n=1 Tax=Saccharopolyspora phatthalungensis TaxID=664693 RepID=A0A840QCH8_9PSEU|nr:DUF3153 domain-containing protein [Saccharopolyspora phatthalungensis]MBB5156239.1 hypothetical protein [Saccharopolyspora phatthalungensis]
MKAKTSRRPAALLLVLISVLGTLLSGCLHVNASLNITGEDLVSGELLVSTQTADGQVPFRLQPPGDLADRVQVTPYNNAGRVGSHLSFHDLKFREVERLAKALSPSDSRYRLHLSRSGSLVIFEGAADLTPLAETGSGVELKISAPGEITNTNGTESAGTVTWVLQPGEVSELSATYQFSNVVGMDWVGWALLVGVLTLVSAVVVGLLAVRTHVRNRPDVHV